MHPQRACSAGKVLLGGPPPSIIAAVAHYPFHFAFPVRDLASTRAAAVYHR